MYVYIMAGQSKEWVSQILQLHWLSSITRNQPTDEDNAMKEMPITMPTSISSFNGRFE